MTLAQLRNRTMSGPAASEIRVRLMLSDGTVVWGDIISLAHYENRTNSTTVLYVLQKAGLHEQDNNG